MSILRYSVFIILFFISQTYVYGQRDSIINPVNQIQIIKQQKSHINNLENKLDQLNREIKRHDKLYNRYERALMEREVEYDQIKRKYKELVDVYEKERQNFKTEIQNYLEIENIYKEQRKELALSQKYNVSHILLSNAKRIQEISSIRKANKNIDKETLSFLSSELSRLEINTMKNKLRLQDAEKELFNIREDVFPTFRPSPPPYPSAQKTFENTVIRNTQSVGEIHNVLLSALEVGGYHQRIYFNCEDGFAIVTQMEQIDKKGNPVAADHRWDESVVWLETFSLKEYLRALIFPKEGRFRVYVFWVSKKPIRFSKTATFEQSGIRNLNSMGSPEGAATVEGIASEKNYSCTVLVYEFVKKEFKKDGEFIKKSKFSGQQHLVKSKMYNVFEYYHWDEK